MIAVVAAAAAIAAPPWRDIAPVGRVDRCARDVHRPARPVRARETRGIRVDAAAFLHGQRRAPQPHAVRHLPGEDEAIRAGLDDAARADDDCIGINPRGPVGDDERARDVKRAETRRRDVENDRLAVWHRHAVAQAKLRHRPVVAHDVRSIVRRIDADEVGRQVHRRSVCRQRNRVLRAVRGRNAVARPVDEVVGRIRRRRQDDRRACGDPVCRHRPRDAAVEAHGAEALRIGENGVLFVRKRPEGRDRRIGGRGRPREGIDARRGVDFAVLDDLALLHEDAMAGIDLDGGPPVVKRLADDVEDVVLPGRGHVREPPRRRHRAIAGRRRVDRNLG